LLSLQGNPFHTEGHCSFNKVGILIIISCVKDWSISKRKIDGTIPLAAFEQHNERKTRDWSKANFILAKRKSTRICGDFQRWTRQAAIHIYIYIYIVCVMHLLICIVYSFCKTKQKLNNDSMQKMKAYQYIL